MPPTNSPLEPDEELDDEELLELDDELEDELLDEEEFEDEDELLDEEELEDELLDEELLLDEEVMPPLEVPPSLPPHAASATDTKPTAAVLAKGRSMGINFLIFIMFPQWKFLRDQGVLRRLLAYPGGMLAWEYCTATERKGMRTLQQQEEAQRHDERRPR